MRLDSCMYICKILHTVFGKGALQKLVILTHRTRCYFFNLCLRPARETSLTAETSDKGMRIGVGDCEGNWSAKSDGLHFDCSKGR